MDEAFSTDSGPSADHGDVGECDACKARLSGFTELAAERHVELSTLVDILQVAAKWLEEHKYFAAVDGGVQQEAVSLFLSGWQDGYSEAISELRLASQILMPVEVPDDLGELFTD